MQTIPVEPKPTTAEPTIVSTAVNYTVPASANYLVLVTGTVADVVVTVSSLRSHRIVNAGSNRIIVDSTTAPNVNVLAGQAVDVMWDTTNNQHRTFLINTVSASVVAANIYATMTQTAHGFTASNVGYCMFGHLVFDDLAGDQVPTSVFVEYVDANSFKFAGAGQAFTLPAAMISGSYSISTNGRFLFWDKSANAWKATKPSDSVATLPPQLMVNSYDATASTYNCTFLGMSPLGA